MTHRAVNDNALRPEVSHHRRHRVRARMVSLRMVRGQWPWMGTSSASRVRGATRPLLAIALDRAGRRHDRAAGAGLRCGHPDARIWSCQVSAAWLVRSQWVHRCSPPWARWRRPHQGHKRCSSSLFLSRPFSSRRSAILSVFHTFLHVLPTSVSVINRPRHHPITRPVCPFYNMFARASCALCLFFPLRTDLILFFSAVVQRCQASILLFCSLLLSRRFFFLSPLNIYSLSRLQRELFFTRLSTHLWHNEAAKGGGRETNISKPPPSLSCSFYSFFFLSDPPALSFALFARFHR